MLKSNTSIWTRYLIFLVITAIPPLLYSLGITPSSVAVTSIYLVMITGVAKWVGLPRSPENIWTNRNRWKDGRVMTQFGIALLVMIAMLYVATEIPGDRALKLFTNPLTAWWYWAIFSLYQLQTCFQVLERQLNQSRITQ